MKENNSKVKVTKFMVVIYTICAFVWVAGAIIKIIGGAAGWDLGLTVFCAVIWTLLMIITIRRYRRQQGEDGGSV